MLIAWIPVLVAVIGLLMWALSSNATVKEAGRILFFCGVLVTLLAIGARSAKLL